MKKLLTVLLSLLMLINSSNLVLAEEPGTGSTDVFCVIEGGYEWSVPATPISASIEGTTSSITVTKATLEPDKMLIISIDGGKNYQTAITGEGSNLKYNMKLNDGYDDMTNNYYVSYKIEQDSTNSNVGDTTKPALLQTGEISKNDPLIIVMPGQVAATNGELTTPVVETLKYTITSDTVMAGDYKDTLTFTAEVKDTVFGIHRNIYDSSTSWIRSDNLQDVIVQASVNGAGYHSDFDDLPIYRDIKRVIIDSTGNELEYTPDNLSLGDVMVRIPKFYYRRYRDGEDNKTEHIEISPIAQSGFELHPAFVRNDSTGISHELDYIYIAAYKTSSNNKSVSNASPTYEKTRNYYRTYARDKVSGNDGWSIIDSSTLSAIQMLILVEYADNNAKKAIGLGYAESFYGTSTGSCDSMYENNQLSGYPGGTSSDKVDVLWRGIEDFISNGSEWTDGLNFYEGTYYVCNDIFKYADDTADNYTALSYTIPTNWSRSYIKEEGLDTFNSWAMMASNATGASDSTYYAGYIYSRSSFYTVYLHGDNLFTMTVNANKNYTQANIGSRLIYLPLPY